MDIYIAYCAGLFEGEGCVSYTLQRQRKKNRITEHPRLTLAINMTDLEPLQMFQEFVDVGVINGPYERAASSTHRHIYRYAINNIDEIKRVMDLMWDLLSPRRKQQWEDVQKMYEDYQLRVSDDPGSI